MTETYGVAYLSHHYHGQGQKDSYTLVRAFYPNLVSSVYSGKNSIKESFAVSSALLKVRPLNEANVTHQQVH
jgi:hypothetical protein